MLETLAILILSASGDADSAELPFWSLSLSGREGAGENRPRFEAFPWLEEQQAQPAAPARDAGGLTLNVAAHARYAIPFGAADRTYLTYGAGLVVVDHYASWADFFHPGWGFDLEVDIFFGRHGQGEQQAPGTNFGLALLLQTDEFGGNSVHDSFGGLISADSMTMNSFLIGGKILQTMGGGFYADGHVALGAVHYSAVMGTFSGAGFLELRDTLFADTWTFASQFRGHAGVRLGPLGIALGLGFRINAPPSEGPRVSMNSGAFWTFDLDLGVELGF